MMNTKSRWATGTYEIHIMPDTEEQPGDLLITVFAKPISLSIEDADEDAPALGQVEVRRSEYDGDLKSWQTGLHDIGEDALLGPESVESIYGGRLALRILQALFEAAHADYKGLDGEGRPWRTPSEEAFPIMKRTHDVLEILKGRFMS